MTKTTIVSNGTSRKASAMPGALSPAELAAQLDELDRQAMFSRDYEEQRTALQASAPAMPTITYVRGGNVLFDGSDFTVVPVVASGMVREPWQDRKSGILKGKTIAWQARQYFRAAFQQYQEACDTHEFVGGDIMAVPVSYTSRETKQRIEKTLIFLCVGDHNEVAADQDYITLGLQNIVSNAAELELAGKSIALPKLGCSTNGARSLDWDSIGREMAYILGHLTDTAVRIHVGKNDPEFQPVYENGTVTDISRSAAAVVDEPRAPQAKATVLKAAK